MLSPTGSWAFFLKKFSKVEPKNVTSNDLNRPDASFNDFGAWYKNCTDMLNLIGELIDEVRKFGLFFGSNDIDRTCLSVRGSSKWGTTRGQDSWQICLCQSGARSNNVCNKMGYAPSAVDIKTEKLDSPLSNSGEHELAPNLLVAPDAHNLAFRSISCLLPATSNGFGSFSQNRGR